MKLQNILCIFVDNSINIIVSMVSDGVGNKLTPFSSIRVVHGRDDKNLSYIFTRPRDARPYIYSSLTHVRS